MFEINIFDKNTMTMFWEYSFALLKGVSPMVLIVMATSAVGLLLTIIIKAYRQSSQEKHDDYSDDYDIRHY